MESKSSDKRFALLIDADNVSARYIKPILNELSKYGTVTIKRIYGDWTLTLHAKWKDALLENSITPIQQFGYTQGKNATDSAMIIDAMDILYTDSVDGFCIVSSDSDFTRLASRLRESGRMVVGMGEKKTPTPFRRACDVFTTLELLVDQKRGKAGGADAAISREEVEQAVVDIITENQNNDKTTGLGEVGSRLLKRYPDFDVRSYGTNLLSKLLEEFTRVKITKSHSSVTVELAEGADKPVDKDAEKPRERNANRSSAAKSAHDENAAPVSAPSTDADQQQGEGSDSAAADSTEQSARKPQRRRRVRKPSQAASPASDEAVPTVNGASAASEDDKVTEGAGGGSSHGDAVESTTPTNAADFAAQIDAAAESDAPGKMAEAASSTRDETPEGTNTEAEGKDDAAAADTAPAAQAAADTEPKPRRRTRRPRKDAVIHDVPPTPATPAAPITVESNNVATQTEPDSAANEGAKANARDAEGEPTTESKKPRRRTRATKTRRPAARQSEVKIDAEPAAEPPAEPVPAQESKVDTAGAIITPQQVIRETIAEAGDAGISLAQVGNAVRSKFKDFKVRDLGFPQMRLYIKSVEDFELIRNGKDLFVKMAR